jgi:hypothetical protein
MEGASAEQDGGPSAACSMMGRARWLPSVDKGMHGCYRHKDMWLHLDSLTSRSLNVGAMKPVQQNHQLTCWETEM